jgi:hypothetical protein
MVYVSSMSIVRSFFGAVRKDSRASKPKLDPSVVIFSLFLALSKYNISYLLRCTRFYMILFLTF